MASGGRRRWKPDKRGVIRAAVGIAATLTGSPLPLGAATDALFALATVDQSLDAWHDRLVAAINRWIAANPQVAGAVGALPSGWERLFVRELERIDAHTLSASDPDMRTRIEEVLANTVFQPLVGTESGWNTARAAAQQLAESWPALVVEAAGPESGLAELLVLLQRDLKTVLDSLPPEPADRTATEAYLLALAPTLDEESWAHRAGGRPSSITALALPLVVFVAQHAEDRRAAGEEPPVYDALDAVARYQRLVVRGGPGAGKTWLARRSGIRAAETALEALATTADPSEVEIPLFASFTRCARRFADGANAWESVVGAALEGVADRLLTGRVNAALQRRFLERPGRYLVLLDGLDEAEQRSGTDLLDRLASADGPRLRIMLTTRPGSWRRQLRLDEKNPEHGLVDVQPLRYPEDVTAVINHSLEQNLAGRDRLVTLLEQRADVAQAAQTPLLCAMYCLIAERAPELPVLRHDLYAEVVSQLMQGTWRGDSLDDQGFYQARSALQELAWAGTGDDPTTGLSAWPDATGFAFRPPLAPEVLAAVSHVAPMVSVEPGASRPARRFVHLSIQEQLIAERLAQLAPADARALIEPHLWYDPQWELVLPSALAGHARRDAVLDELLGGSADKMTLNRRDGFGEFRRFLVRLAPFSAPFGG